MAEATVTVPSSDVVDQHIEVLISEWAGIPALAGEWPEWDEYSKRVEVEEWGHGAALLAELRRWAADGLMSCEQYERYRVLLALVAKHTALRAHLAET